MEEPPKLSQDSSSPEPNVDSQDGSLTDHELNTGTAKSPGGLQPMAPGVFLSQRRPSMSSPNNSTNSTSTNSSSTMKADRGGSADAKGEHTRGAESPPPTTAFLTAGLKSLVSLSLCVAAKRLKKGMATAKQRLGKILKIHRNGKLLL